MGKFDFGGIKDKGVGFISSTREAVTRKISESEIDLYSIIKAGSYLPMKGLFSLTVTGLENVPESGPVILAANHRSFVDSLFIPHVMKRKVTFVAKAEYFDSPKTRWIFEATNQIPIRRGSSISGKHALDAAKEVLEAGGVFAIYPEGTRTRDGFLHRGHTGVARLAAETGATLIPVGLIGTEHIQSTKEKIPRPGKKVEVHFGKPINIEKYGENPDTGLAFRNITDELMFEIYSLCNYGYVDTYTGSL